MYRFTTTSIACIIYLSACPVIRQYGKPYGKSTVKTLFGMAGWRGKKRDGKAQSAMEYLMTYGWAILIIAVVLAVLFEIGVFNGSALAPKAPPGSCSVYRPEGPGTTLDINLGGVCNGELPQYVTEFSGSYSYAYTDYVPQISEALTFVAWINPSTYASCDGSGNPSCMVFNKEAAYEWSFASNGELYFALNDTTCASLGGWRDGGVCWTGTGLYAPTSTWSMIALTYNSAYVTAYLTSQAVNSIPNTGSIGNTANYFYIGGRSSDYNGIDGSPSPNSFFDGLLANVQIYNASLSSNQITALYDEGIGGAPINLQHLVAWYPLNGNANDSSGNGDNGVPANVVWKSNWETGYTAP